jgi:hypothetical protein
LTALQDVRALAQVVRDPAIAASISRLHADRAIRKIYFRVGPELGRRELKVRKSSGLAKIARSTRAKGRDSRAWLVRLQIVESCGEQRTRMFQDLPAGSRYERVWQDCAAVGVGCARAEGRGFACPACPTADHGRLWLLDFRHFGNLWGDIGRRVRCWAGGVRR